MTEEGPIIILYLYIEKNMKKIDSECSLVLVEHELDRKNDVRETFRVKVLEVFSWSKYSHIWFLMKENWKQYFLHSSMSHIDHAAWLWYTEINEYLNRSDVKSLKIIPLHKNNLKLYSNKKLKKVTKSIKKIYKSITWTEQSIDYDYFAVVSLDVFNIANTSKYNCGTFVNSILKTSVLYPWVNYSLPSIYNKKSIKDYVILRKSWVNCIL